MGYSTNTYTYTGGPQTFSVNFADGFLERDHVVVYRVGDVDGLGDQVYLSFTWNSDSEVLVTDSLASGDEIVVERNVEKQHLLVDLTAPGALTREALERNARQTLHVAHEVLDGRWDENLRDVVTTARDGAVAAQTAAETAQTSAEAARDLATTRATAAAASAGDAAGHAANALSYRDAAEVARDEARAVAVAVLPFAGRPAVVVWVAGSTAPDGTVISDGVVQYIARAGTTSIADMPGWLPFGELSSLHFAENTVPRTTDMTDAIKDALAYGSAVKTPVRIKGAQAFSSRITIPSDTGLIGANEHSDYLYALAAGFSNTDVTAPVGDTNLCLDFSGEVGGSFTPNENQLWAGVGLVYEKTEGRVVSAALAMNCKNFNVRGVRFQDFPTGRLLKCGTLTGNWSIEHVEARDCRNATAHTGGGAANMQITVVEVDNDVVNGVASTAGTIRYIYGYNLGNSGVASTAAGGVQSDVVNVQRGYRHHIEDVYGQDVGEVVDVFANECTGGGFRGLRTEGSVLKLIHGASKNVFHGVSGNDCGQQVVSFSEGNGGYLSQATAGNRVYGVNAYDIDADGLYGGGYTTACVRFDGGGGGIGCYDNAVYGLNADPGANGRYTVHAEADTERNVVEVNSFAQGTDGTFNGPVTVKLAVAPNVVARSVASQSVPISTPTTVAFGTTLHDARGDYASPTFTAPVGGVYSIDATVEFNAQCAGNITIYVGGVEAERNTISATEETTTYTISRTMVLAAGDTVTIAVEQSSGTRNITATSGRTKFSARSVV